MADAIVSAVAQRIIGLIEEQARYHLNLVRGAEEEVRSLARELNIVRNVLNDAENRRFKEKSVKDWLVRLERTSYEMEDVLDEWNYAILKLQMEKDHQYDDAKPKVWSFIPSSPCLCFKKLGDRHDIAQKILNVKAQLDEVLKEKDNYNFVMSQPTSDPSPNTWRDPSTSFTDLAEVQGRKYDRDNLVTKLIGSGGRREELGIQVVSIVGVGGVGKTTLAQLVYNDSRVESYFDLRIWVCVSNLFDQAAIAKGIIESTRKGGSPSTNNLDSLLQLVSGSISEKKFLLVLDDVWTEDPDKWKPLKSALKSGGVAGSKVLVTTRNQNVAEIMDTVDDDIHHLGKLTNEECWLLLHNEAFSGRNREKFEAFKDIGEEIALKRKGLPLAAKVLGRLLRFKSSLEEWNSVLKSEIWQLEKAEIELFPHLLLSYNEFTPMLKRCFSYCAVFPKDSKIVVNDLIGNWMALGYLGSNGDMELKGRECFEVLAARSLFQDFKKYHWGGQIRSCKMHDIVHEFAQFLRNSGRREAAGMDKTTCQANDHPLLVSSVNEFCSLVREGESLPDLCDCLTRVRVLSLIRCGLQSIPQGMANLIHLRWLKLSDNTLSGEDLKIIFQLYILQSLMLSHCSLEEIPREIGNLIHLRHIDLSDNGNLKKLPESICGLHELRTLNVNFCTRFSTLPEGIHRLVNLKHLHNYGTPDLKQFPQGIARLTSLHTLCRFRGGSGSGKLGWMKNLNLLSGSLELKIILAADDDLAEVIEDARGAELRKKKHIQKLIVDFEDRMYIWKEPLGRLVLIDVLEPHPNLQKLSIWSYDGPELPTWIVSPALKSLRQIEISDCDVISSLPSLGKLPWLEELEMYSMRGLKSVGQEFLGIQSASEIIIGFPKLKKLTFYQCHNWIVWDDITAEQDSAAVSLMPCLTVLNVKLCCWLTRLPLRLLRKMSSLEVLDISSSERLRQHHKDSTAPESIYRNPRLRIIW